MSASSTGRCLRHGLAHRRGDTAGSRVRGLSGSGAVPHHFRNRVGFCREPLRPFRSVRPESRRHAHLRRPCRQGREVRYLGHNPAGAAMIITLLVTLSGTAFTGWLMEEPARAAAATHLLQFVAPVLADDDDGEGLARETSTRKARPKGHSRRSPRRWRTPCCPLSPCTSGAWRSRRSATGRTLPAPWLRAGRDLLVLAISSDPSSGQAGAFRGLAIATGPLDS